MTVFTIPGLLAEHQGEGADRWRAYLNPQMAGMLQVIGFSRTWVRGEGAWVWDDAGDPYLDLMAGFGTFSAGRGNPVIARAVHDVLDARVADMMQLDTPLLPGLLAEKLLEKAPGLDRAWFCNSGTEAVEAALKFARCATGRSRVLYCANGFHGLTLGALSANGSPEFRRGFGTLLPSAMIPAGDLAALKAELVRGGVAALITEPVQGHGTYVVPDGWLAEAARLCHRHGALLICDEVQTGLGRTGRWFAYQHEPGFVPDIVTVAKALGGGYAAAGAVLARDKIVRSVFPSMSASFRQSTTSGGNAVAMAAGLATMHVLEDGQLVSNAARTGDVLHRALTAMARDCPLIGGVRGRGLMLGVEFRRPSDPRLLPGWYFLHSLGPGLAAQCASSALMEHAGDPPVRHRVLTAVAGAGLPVLRLTPPLVIGDREVSKFLMAWSEVMDWMHSGSGPMRDYALHLAGQGLAARLPGRRRHPARAAEGAT
jgi:ornithine--oxo-acid transaminase